MHSGKERMDFLHRTNKFCKYCKFCFHNYGNKINSVSAVEAFFGRFVICTTKLEIETVLDF